MIYEWVREGELRPQLIGGELSGGQAVDKKSSQN